MDITMSDFIDVKSPKAKGKRITTLDISSITDITPEPEPQPEPEAQEENNEENKEEHNNKELDVPFTITNDLPESSKPVDEQLSLF